MSESESSGMEPTGAPSSAAAVPEPVPGTPRADSHEAPALADSAANGTVNVPAEPESSAAASAASSAEADAPAPEASSEDASSGDESGTPSAEELNRLMEQYTAPQQGTTEGEIVEGRVVAISDSGVVVDIGAKTEGLIPAQEFLESDQPMPFSSGQTIEVQLTGEHKEGYVLLSYQRAHRRRGLWPISKRLIRKRPT